MRLYAARTPQFHKITILLLFDLFFFIIMRNVSISTIQMTNWQMEFLLITIW